MFTMTEILDVPRAWAVLDANTQITMGPVYVERIWYRVGSAGDQVDLYDGTGATGKRFNIMEATADTIKSLPVGLVFHAGLYFSDTSGNANVIISYVPLSE